MLLDWIDILAIVGAAVVAVLATLVCLRFKLWEYEEGRIGDEPIIKYTFFPVLVLVAGGGVASYFGIGYALRQLFGG